MCTGAEIALVGAALASTAGTAYIANDQAKKQDQAAAAGIRSQRELQREQDAKVNRVLQDVEGSTADDERITAERAYLDQVEAAQGKARANLSQRGLSTAYDEGAQAAGDSAEGYARQIGELMASIDAPVNQRIGEGFMFSDLSTGIGQTERASAGQQWIDALKAKTIRPNPWLQAGVAALGGVGQYAGGKGAGGGNVAYKTGANVKGGY